jgi:putative addiction module CopG family antidote
MHTINVSLPSQLKLQADQAVQAGYFASFSDLVRTALRHTLTEMQLNSLANQAINEHRSGQAKTLKNTRAVDQYVDQVFEGLT